MKNKILISLITLLLLSGCSSKASYSSTSDSNRYSASSESSEIYEDYYGAEEYSRDVSEHTVVNKTLMKKDGTINIQSSDHNSFQAELDSLVVANGAYIESQNITTKETTSGSYIIKVPSDNFTSLFTGIEALGKVSHSEISQLNITNDYINTNSYIQIKKIEEERLLAIRSQAKDIKDIIALEEKLAEVRTAISTKTALANSMVNEANYSEITVIYNDDEKISLVSLKPSFLTQIKNAFLESISSLQYVLIFFAYIALPVTILIIFTALCLFIYRRTGKKNK